MVSNTHHLEKNQHIQNYSNSNIKNKMSEQEIKTNSLAMKIFKIFKGAALILANLFALGLKKISKTVQEEYKFVFCNTRIIKKSNLSQNSDESSDCDLILQKKFPIMEKIFSDIPHNKNAPKVEIDQTVQNRLSEIFGIEDIFNKVPVYEKIIDSSLDLLCDLPCPIMKGTIMVYWPYKDTYLRKHLPFIAVKLKVADPKEFYRMHSGNHKMNSKPSSKTIKVISDKTYTRYFYQNNPEKPTSWVPNGISPYENEYVSNDMPSFLCVKEPTGECSNYPIIEQNTIPACLKEQIHEFQKLFTKGIGTDVFGNKWKLATD